MSTSTSTSKQSQSQPLSSSSSSTTSSTSNTTHANMTMNGHIHSSSSSGQPWKVPEHIIVNNFKFCAAHGDEFCQMCLCDHRMVNNVTVEDELSEVAEFLDFEVEERQQLNVYLLGAQAALTTEHSYQCEKHKIVDCKSCFDWIRIIKKEAKETEESGRWMSKRNSLQEKLESGVLTQFGPGIGEERIGATAAVATGIGAA